MSFNKKKAFSLTEALIMLLIASLTIVATMPLITIKHMRLPDKAPHGKWACKLINGEMYSATAANVNAKMPDDSKWKKGCAFPILPSSVSYIIVQTIGGGASGSYGALNIGTDNKTENLFPKGEDNETYVVEETGKYKVFFPGDYGLSGKLTPSSLSVVLNGIKKQDCFFSQASGNKTVPSVSFDYELKRGDKLTLKLDNTHTENQYNGEGQHLCNASNPATAVWVDSEGTKFTEPYYFQVINHDPGKSGPTRRLIINDGSSKQVAEIKGTGGGYYASSSDACTIDCSKRYINKYDRAKWDLSNYISTAGGISAASSFSSSNVAKISSQGYTISYYGGCGGAAGQVNTVLMEKPENTAGMRIEIGKAGLNGGNGGNTVFDYITAYGGIGCYDPAPNTSLDGQDGENANTEAIGDSSAGKGGKGKIKKPVPSEEEMNGKNALGFGSGGGGGGFAFNIDKPIEEYLKNSLIYQLENYKVLGKPGNGASGGIIISW